MMEITTIECPICLSEISSNEIITTEVCKHNFCKTCFIKWVTINQTCPLDRQRFANILFLNQQEIQINVPFQSVVLESMFKTNFLKLFSKITVFYDKFHSIIDFYEKLYNKFEKEEFQLFLNSNSEFSKEYIMKFLTEFRSLAENYLKILSDFNEDLHTDSLILDENIEKLNLFEKNSDDSLAKYIEEVKLLSSLFQILKVITNHFEEIKTLIVKYQSNIKTFDNLLAKNIYQDGYSLLMKNNNLIFENIKLVKSRILHFSSDIVELDYGNIFDTSLENCLICTKTLNETIVNKFDNCHHKICSKCQHVYLLSNFSCPFDHQSENQNIIFNSTEIEKYLYKSCDSITETTLEEISKIIIYIKENLPNLISGSIEKFSQINSKTFSNFYILKLKEFENIQQKFQLIHFIENQYSKHFSDEFKSKLEIQLDTYDNCEHVLYKMIEIIKAIQIFEYIYMFKPVSRSGAEKRFEKLKDFIENKFKKFSFKFSFLMKVLLEKNQNKNIETLVIKIKELIK